MFPLASFDAMSIAECNRLLERWGHRMGPFERPDFGGVHGHALFVHGEPVGVAITARLIATHVGGGNEWPQDLRVREFPKVAA